MDGQYGRKQLVRWALVCVLLLGAAVALAAMTQGVERARELSRCLTCQAQLKHLGAALNLYLADSRDWWPRTSDEGVEALLEAGLVTEEFCTCPDGERIVFLLPPTREAADTATGDSGIVWAYEPLCDQNSEGGNVLFTDGHVEFTRLPTYKTVIAESKRKLGIEP